jgi:hypothetical protein
MTTFLYQKIVKKTLFDIISRSRAKRFIPTKKEKKKNVSNVLYQKLLKKNSQYYLQELCRKVRSYPKEKKQEMER